MNEQEMKKSIMELAQMNVELNAKGGPGKAGKLFEKLLEKQDEVLETLGLPNTPYYQQLLEFDSVPWDNEFEKLVQLLQHEIENQKAKPQKSDVEILREAVQIKRDGYFILPQIGIPTHCYTLYVYNYILMLEHDSPENVLAELKLANDGLLNTLGIIGVSIYCLDKKKVKARLAQTVPDKKLDALVALCPEVEWLKYAEEQIKFLEKRGLKYARQYTIGIIEQFKERGFVINEISPC
jgi:hypothetical protein